MIAPAKKTISSVKELRKIPQEHTALKGVKQILVCAGGAVLPPVPTKSLPRCATKCSNKSWPAK